MTAIFHWLYAVPLSAELRRVVGPIPIQCRLFRYPHFSGNRHGKASGPTTTTKKTTTRVKTTSPATTEAKTQEPITKSSTNDMTQYERLSLQLSVAILGQLGMQTQVLGRNFQATDLELKGFDAVSKNTRAAIDAVTKALEEERANLQ